MQLTNIEFIDYIQVGREAEYVVQKSVIAAYLGSILSLVMFFGICLPLVLDERTTAHPIIKLLIFCMGALAPIMFFWVEKKSGLFVIAANKHGIFYRVYGDLGKAVFIPWLYIDRVSITRRDEVNRLTFHLVANEEIVLPRPAHGNRFPAYGDYPMGWLDFSVMGKRKIITKLNAFKKDSTSTVE